LHTQVLSSGTQEKGRFYWPETPSGLQKPLNRPILKGRTPVNKVTNLRFLGIFEGFYHEKKTPESRSLFTEDVQWVHA
jgi:hypothetical protein